MKKSKLYFCLSLVFLFLFIAFTIIVLCVDKRVVGDAGSIVGLSSINRWFYERFKFSEIFDFISDITMIVWLLIASLFVFLGIVQWFERKKLKLVDKKYFSIFILYTMVIVSYLLFEILAINKRPILVDGVLEISYPSTHTLFAICVFGSFCLMCQEYIKNKRIKTIVISSGCLFILASVVIRVFSGMHWFTDIVGSVFLGCALVFIMLFVNEVLKEKSQKTYESIEK